MKIITAVTTNFCLSGKTHKNQLIFFTFLVLLPNFASVRWCNVGVWRLRPLSCFMCEQTCISASLLCRLNTKSRCVCAGKQPERARILLALIVSAHSIVPITCTSETSHPHFTALHALRSPRLRVWGGPRCGLRSLSHRSGGMCHWCGGTCPLSHIAEFVAAHPAPC